MNVANDILYGAGSLLTMADGRILIDLSNGYGSVFLGHGHDAIVSAVQRQAAQVFNCGRLPNAARRAADAGLISLLPPGMTLAGTYSTGMESIEFALRVAALHTGRAAFLGFARSMHGKSAITASLCWDNAPIGCPQARVLPFTDGASEAEILERVEAQLRKETFAALLVEPVQGSNGCRSASPIFYAELLQVCRRYGTLCLFDEYLTGLYRTGPRFFCEGIDLQPDLLVFGKSMANGFPCGAVALRDDIALAPGALPGSTFAGNPLAAAATAATITAMEELPIIQLVRQIGAVVESSFAPCVAAGFTLRGAGALWSLAPPPDAPLPALDHIAAAGVVIAPAAGGIRLLPAATIDPALLADACGRIAAICLKDSLQ